MLAGVAFLTQLFWFQEGRELYSFEVWIWQPTIYEGGVEKGVEIASRIIGGMATLLFFSLTTPLPELMRAARFFRVPPVLVELALIMYRSVASNHSRLAWAARYALPRLPRRADGGPGRPPAEIRLGGAGPGVVAFGDPVCHTMTSSGSEGDLC